MVGLNLLRSFLFRFVTIVFITLETILNFHLH